MSWNYRVVKRDDVFRIHEAYYNGDGEIYAITAEPIYIQGDTLEELEHDLAYYAAALAKPVLDYNDLPFTRDEPERLPPCVP